MNYHLLALVFTYECTSSCNICCFSCSPDRKEKMNLGDAKKYISEAREAGIKMAGIAGGEPFLHFEEVIELLKYIKSLGMTSTVTSNCFWAESYNKTFRVLKTLKDIGVNSIKISSDEFHSKYVSYENIKNVLNVAKTINFRLILGCTSTKNSARLKGLLEHLQDEAVCINLIEQTCFPLGRAKESFDEEEFIYAKTIDESCREQGMLTITPDGNVYPCGSMCGMIPNRLVGSVFEESLQSLIKKATDNKHNKFLSKYSIKPYYNYIQKNKLPIKTKIKFINSCHACYELFNNDENIPYLNSIVDSLEKSIQSGC